MLPPSRSVNEFAGVRDSVRRKESFETDDVAVLRRCDERFKESPQLSRTRGRHPITREMLPRAGHDLPRVGLCKSKDVCDVAVRVVERLPEDVSGAFSRCEPLQ